MAENSGELVMTNQGNALAAKLLAGESTIVFTRIVTSEQDYSDCDLKTLEELEIKQDTLVSRVERDGDSVVTVYGTLDARGIAEGYYIRAVGLYAQDTEGIEILYAVVADVFPKFLAPYNDGNRIVSGATFKLHVKVGNAGQVSLEVNPAAAPSLREVQDLQGKVAMLEEGLDGFVKNVSFDKGSSSILIEKGSGGKESIPVSSEAYIVSGTAPEDTKSFWIDTTNSGIMKYYDVVSGMWKIVPSAWS